MRRQIWLMFTLCIVTIIRVYRIEQPLWLDELYGYNLAKKGFEAIIHNSWTDPHPPFYYLIEWIISGFGHIRSESGWRWLPLLCGVLTIFVIWHIISDMGDSVISTAVCLMAATLPTLVFYSQEARPFSLLVLLASLSMWFTIALLRRASMGRLWIGWSVITLLGLHTGYSYLMVAGIQIAFLGYFYHRLAVWRTATMAIIVGGALALLPFARSSLGQIASNHANTQALSLWRTLQTLLAGEPIRYGLSPSHIIFPLLALGLCVIATIEGIRLRDNRIAYLVIQIAVPMGGFFALSPLLHIRLPLPEAKQFIVLIPSLLVLLANGIIALNRRLGHRTGYMLSIALCGTMVVLNAMGLRSYWTHPKSPEGLAVIKLRSDLKLGENVVSLHYSLNYALKFYTSDIPIYAYPEPQEEGFRYQLTNSEHILDFPASPKWKTAKDIRASGTFWILAHSTAYREPIDSLISGCQIVERETFEALNGSHEMMKVDCPAPR
jgi:hypothetical protein